MRKSTMRQAFEAAQFAPGAERSPLVRRCVRVMEKGGGLKFGSKRRHHRKPEPK